MKRMWWGFLLPTAAVAVLTGLVLLAANPAAAYVYVAAGNATPGTVLSFTAAAGEAPVYTRSAADPLLSFTIGPSIEPSRGPFGPLTAQTPMTLYYCDQRAIYRAGEVMVFRNDHLREVAFGPGGALYFSVVADPTAEGRIYKLERNMAPVSYYVVQPAQVDGRWDGHFAFNRSGRLFIANGEMNPAKLWYCPPSGAAPLAVFTHAGPILGFSFLSLTRFIFADGTNALRVANLNGTTATVLHTSSRGYKYCDVLVTDIKYP